MVFIKEPLSCFGGILWKTLPVKPHLGLRKGARHNGREEQKLQIRKIILSACRMCDHFSLEQMPVMETLKLEMPLQDILLDFWGFYASFLEISAKGNRPEFTSRQTLASPNLNS